MSDERLTLFFFCLFFRFQHVCQLFSQNLSLIPQFPYVGCLRNLDIVDQGISHLPKERDLIQAFPVQKVKTF